MTVEVGQKVTPRHLRRRAYLYIRQSTLRQVFENTESTKRQYALRQRAVALGWPQDQIVVIDRDLGQSGTSAVDREGFQRLVTEVGMGRAGIVMGLEVSRLARNSTDWHRLLEICALTETLILDEDGIYDPAHFNDRLLLGLKGTMSEAELHMLRARLQGGILNKARRGELESALPIGFVYDAQKQVVLDPDQQVQESIRLFFETFRRTGAATATVKFFRKKKLLFPRRVRHGVNKGDLLWGELEHSRALRVLHSPRFAGAFCYGRTTQRRQTDGRMVMRRLPRDEWITLIRDAHEGYITWKEYEENQRRLRDNAAIMGLDRRKSPPREGPALLQGLVVCGKCGRRMTVRYHRRQGCLYPDYTCQRRGIEYGEPICQCVPGENVDASIGRLLVEMVSPLALEVALTVQQELQARLDETDRLRKKQITRARYEAELARRRYMQVDPDNRLVADALEAEWNDRLRALSEAQQEYERQSQSDRGSVSEQERSRILALATDFPKLWNDPNTPQRERKRMVRLLVEDVTLIKGKELTAQVRFRGGKSTTFSLPLPLPIGELRKTDPALVAKVDRLLDQYTEKKAAMILTEQGLHSVVGKPLRPFNVRNIRNAYGLKSRYDRLREAGLLTASELADKLNVVKRTVTLWRRKGLLKGIPYDDHGRCLYADPGDAAPVKYQHRGKQRGGIEIRKLVSNTTEEVQCET
jgi:DNA invertase Pin-like site-specific DNA recombinase